MNVITQFDPSGRVALVTGCKRGIGKSRAIGLAEAGADIVRVSASLELSGSTVGKEVQALGRSFRAYQCDLSQRSAVHAFLAILKRDIPVLDILVNNAGTILH